MLLALTGVISIGLGAVLAAMSEVGPFATALWRMAFGAPICLVICILWPGGAHRTAIVKLLGRREIWLAGAAFAGTILLWYSGQRLSSVASTSTLHNMTPIVVLAFMWIIYGQQPQRHMIQGVIIGIFGATLLAWHSGETAAHGLFGDSLAVISAFCLATYYIITAKLIQHAPAIAIMAVVAFVCVPLILPFAWYKDGNVVPATRDGWLIVLGVAICGQVMGQVLLVAAARRLGAAGISAITLAEPVAATAFSILLMSSPVAAMQLAAVALVMLGVYLCQKRSSTRPSEKPQANNNIAKQPAS